MPLVMMVKSSDCVSLARNGRIVNGASVCPMKMLADTHVASAPEMRISLYIAKAMAFTKICMMPR